LPLEPESEYFSIMFTTLACLASRTFILALVRRKILKFLETVKLVFFSVFIFLIQIAYSSIRFYKTFNFI